MDELQAGIEPPLAVFPEAPVLFQPGKAALNDPALGNDREFVQLATRGYLYRDLITQDFLYTLRKRLTHLTAVCPQALYFAHPAFAAL